MVWMSRFDNIVFVIGIPTPILKIIDFILIFIFDVSNIRSFKFMLKLSYLCWKYAHLIHFYWYDFILYFILNNIIHHESGRCYNILPYQIFDNVIENDYYSYLLYCIPWHMTHMETWLRVKTLATVSNFYR